MCCNGSSWKREEKVDHKFDFVDVREFHTGSFGARTGYLFCWFAIIKSFVIFGLDVYTAVGLLVIKNYSQGIQQQNFIAHDKTKWIFVGSIGLSVVLIAWDWIKAIRIMRSRNISFAFTNLIANRCYAARGYDYYCLWHKLSDSQHRQDVLSFWVYFSFIGWKRLILSEGPRQAINALTVFSVMSTRNFSLDVRAYQNITVYQWTILSMMTLSLLIWAFSFARFCIAALFYLPLLCHLRGGLEEFVVRRVDKRIERIIEKARRKRLDRYARARAAVNAAGGSDTESIKSGKRSQHGAGAGGATGLSRNKSILVAEKPTLPNFAVDDEDHIGLPPVPRAGMQRSSSSSTVASQLSHASIRKHEYEKDAGRAMPPLQRVDTLPVYQARPQPNNPYLDDRRLSPPVPPMPAAGQPRNFSARPHTGMSAPPAVTGPGMGAYQQPRRPPLDGMTHAPSYHRQESFDYARQAEFRARSAGQPQAHAPMQGRFASNPPGPQRVLGPRNPSYTSQQPRGGAYEMDRVNRPYR
ncbi:Potassium transporter [Savitreella phatthalungensis]